MTTKRKLGIYFGEKSLSVVETHNQVPEKFVSAPHGMFDAAEGTSAPDEITLTAIIQKSLRDQKITNKEVSLSLPTRETILRSFVIPWMQPSEQRGVVEFEARKYIPFKLEDLAYAYHPITFTEKNTKRIRIVLSAIKKDILEKYTRILEQSGLNVTFIEPGAMSLVRALLLRNQIPPQQRIAIVHTNDREGRIIIVNEGIPYFVREFQLLPSGTNLAEANPELLTARLFNEVRNSLNYYYRQHDLQKIDGIITLSIDDSNNMFRDLGQELGIPTISLSAHSVLGTSSLIDIELLHAFGIGLKDAVATPATFDLSKKSAASGAEGEAINVRSMVKTAIVCVAILLLTFFFANRIPQEYQNRIAQINDQQGPYQSLNIVDIEQKNKEAVEKLAEYKRIVVASNMTGFLNAVPNALPEGAWLRDMQIDYYETANNTSKAAIELAGYAFQENVNQQIRMVNTFIDNLKTDKTFSQSFESIELVSAETQNLNGHMVTSFKISCR